MQIEERVEERDQIINKLPKFQKELTNSIINGDVTDAVMELCKEIIKNESITFKNLSPKSWCHKINKKVFIFHGANDSMVPYTESLQLAKYLPNAELLISYIYEHKEISTNQGIFFKAKELFRMLNFFSKFYYYNEN